jgi:hypothetical protein
MTSSTRAVSNTCSMVDFDIKFFGHSCARLPDGQVGRNPFINLVVIKSFFDKLRMTP